MLLRKHHLCNKLISILHRIPPRRRFVAKEPVEPITESGRRLMRVALTRRQLTQSSLAALIGKHRSTVSRILNGHLRKATVSTLRELEKALDLVGNLQAQYD